jgi:hypothetical protein
MPYQPKDDPFKDDPAPSVSKREVASYSFDVWCKNGNHYVFLISPEDMTISVSGEVGLSHAWPKAEGETESEALKEMSGFDGDYLARKMLGKEDDVDREATIASAKELAEKMAADHGVKADDPALVAGMREIDSMFEDYSGMDSPEGVASSLSGVMANVFSGVDVGDPYFDPTEYDCDVVHAKWSYHVAMMIWAWDKSIRPELEKMSKSPKGGEMT